MNSAKRGGVDGAHGWEVLRVVNTRRRVRLPAGLPAVVEEQALKEQGQQVLVTLLAVRMWADLPPALLTRAGP